MDKEENKMGVKRKSKLMGTSFDSDDDEPIGILLKLKGKKNSKKSKVVAEGGGKKVKGVEKMGVEDEELGGMDDTLANFRKKLRGPKKDGGSATAARGELTVSVVEPSCLSLNESAKDLEVESDLMPEVQKRGLGSNEGGSSADATVVQSLKVKARVKGKKSKANSDTKVIIGKEYELDDGFGDGRSGSDALQHEKEGAVELVEEPLEDSLSAFFQKVQSGLISKFRSSSKLKQEKDIQVSRDGIKPKTGAEDTVQSQVPSELVENFVVPDENSHGTPDQGSMKSDLIYQSVDERLPEVLNCTTGPDSKQGIPTTPAESNQIYRLADNVDDSFTKVISVDSASISLVQRSPSSLRVCSDKITGLGDGKIDYDPIGDLPGSTNEPTDSNSILDRKNEVFHSMETDDVRPSTSPREDVEQIRNDVKLNHGLDADLGSKYSGEVELHLSSSALNRQQKDPVDPNDPVIVLDKCFEETDFAQSSPPEADDQVLGCKSSPVSASDNLKREVAFRAKHEDDSRKAVDESGHASDLLLLEGACPPKSDYASEDEDVHGSSYSSMDHQGSCPEDKKESSQSVVHRLARNAKKHRHGDMAYEGDSDWEILMQGQEFFISHQVGDKTREKFSLSSTVVDAENAKAAAVSAGLKARAVSPIEKIKFKEVLKRKGGLHEYLECRNRILSVWNKDVSRILPLADFGVSDAPLVDESPRASLIRDIFNFLDHCGYINFGVPSEKEKVGNSIKHDLKLLTEENSGEDSGLPVADSQDRASFIPEKEKCTDTCIRGEHADADAKVAVNAITAEALTNVEVLESSAPGVPEGCSLDDSQRTISLDPLSLKEAAESEYSGSIPSCKDENNKTVAAVHQDLLPPDEAVAGVLLKLPKGGSATLSASMECAYSHTQCDSGPRKSIIIVGAGPAGLTAARHLKRQGFVVTVLEARSRIGGRVFTDRSSLSVPVDLGASIITGVEADVATERRPDPSSLICAQLGLEMTVLNSDCPLYDTVTGQKVPADLDEALEAEYNSLLDDMELLAAEKGERAMKMSLEEGLEYGLKRHRMAHSGQDDMKIVPVKSPDTTVAAEIALDDEVSDAQGYKTEGLSPLERRVMDWHFAHLEYGCAALLREVSLPNWNQDDVYGGFGGAHCMIKGGYSAVVESLGEGICVHMDHVVTDISYRIKDSDDKLHDKVKVSTSNGKEFSGDAVLVTVPLGCLKAETIKFSPPLPQWKYLSIKRLGFGVLNKVVLEFPEVFWDDTIDYFGATAEDKDQRGWCFMFWNVKKTVGAPVLIALVVGKAAIVGQNISSSDHVGHALLVLRKLFGEDKVSDPVASVVTDWGKDPYSYGAYSYVAVGSSGEDYDILGRPVENCVFFAGEATCKEHPDTVGGAMLSGLREAVRIVDILNTGTDYTTEVEAMEAARRHLDIERSEVKDIIRKLDAVEFSSALYTKSVDGSRISNWGCMLKDMFFTAKTTAGRLHLAKELLNVPVGFLKTFASTKEGLSTLNSWILDSMGKDGTQLLRHCVRLLVLVSNDLLAVRLSGVGKTIKEKVCVHTSRDIRAIASQLVSVWVELFRKEKASKSGRKILRQSTPLDSKSKSSLVLGKPPLRMHNNVESKGSSKGSASAGNQFASKPVKTETRIHPSSDVQLSNSHGSIGGRNVMEEENHEIPMSEEEKAAFAAAEAARAAAIAAAKAYASSGAMHNATPPPPKILSFHKFAMRGQNAHMDEPDSRKNWPSAAIGRQDCLSEIDSRNCRVRDWSVDFSAAGINLQSSKMSVDNRSQRSHSNEIANQLNFREHSGESVAVDSSILTKAWVDSAGSMGIKDYNAIDRWQCQAAAASSGFSHGRMHITDEEDSSMSSKSHKRKHDAPANESCSASQVTINKESKGNHHRGTDRIKQSVVDYVASLLMPLYKARKIDRESYKTIMKKTATKVMEQTNDAEKAMSVFEFLDFKRKNKIRAFVDMLIERHMATRPDGKSGSSEKD
ncbi:hypothetical protein BUALT_Bualt08G0079400 [Buddleja alternifolia]|uniref:SWIRM domain-containing protein n=1 Tax=Buddleja alternifolia TaxID=168488 RepID=A0AAV6X622_9LAMI|nr:hypothetical protein BUALT_Bualt08G0079400 [Buddleja alternifolia]